MYNILQSILGAASLQFTNCLAVHRKVKTVNFFVKVALYAILGKC